MTNIMVNITNILSILDDKKFSWKMCRCRSIRSYVATNCLRFDDDEVAMNEEVTMITWRHPFHPFSVSLFSHPFVRSRTHCTSLCCCASGTCATTKINLLLLLECVATTAFANNTNELNSLISGQTKWTPRNMNERTVRVALKRFSFCVRIESSRFLVFLFLSCVALLFVLILKWKQSEQFRMAHSLLLLLFIFRSSFRLFLFSSVHRYFILCRCREWQFIFKPK